VGPAERRPSQKEESRLRANKKCEAVVGLLPQGSDNLAVVEDLTGYLTGSIVNLSA
jgi:hypothetical protein